MIYSIDKSDHEDHFDTPMGHQLFVNQLEDRYR